jgi:hypothetical protein
MTMSKHTGVGLLVTVEEVAPLSANLDGQIEALNGVIPTCNGLTSADKLAWQGFYNGWKQGPLATWNFFSNLSQQNFIMDPSVDIAEIIALPGLYADMLGYQKVLPSWQSKTAAACSGYTSPPGIPGPQPLPNSPWWTQFTDTAKILGGIAVAGLVAWGTFEVITIAGPLITARVAAKAPEPREGPRVARAAPRVARARDL